MFSTFTSFLPSAFQSEPKSPSPLPTPSAQNGTPQSKGAVDAATAPGSPNSGANSEERGATATDAFAGVKKRERKNANETFIVVRPPPAKSNHPLNLQVQLVPPKIPAEHPTSSHSCRTSLERPTTPSNDNETTLSRTPSNRSDVSAYSGYTSVSSFSSVATSSSTSSSRRMIIPLYNLQAHNVMTNIIVDAGTDAKIAKCAKRGMEMIGLAVLEPSEVFGRNSSLTTNTTSVPNPGGGFTGGLTVPPQSPSARASMDDGAGQLLTVGDRPETPTSSSVSIPSVGLDHTPHHHFAAPPLSPPATAETPKSKKMFGKFFKRKDTGASGHGRTGSITTPPVSPSPTTSSFLKPTPRNRGLNASGHSKRSSILSTNNTPASDLPPNGLQFSDSVPPSPGFALAAALQPAVLGIQPTLNSSHNPPKGKPHSYAWIVRKWLKGSNAGLLGNVMGMMERISVSGEGGARRSLRVQQQVMPEGVVEVQFIWSRGNKKSRRRGGRVGKDKDNGSPGSGTGVGRRASVRKRGSLALSSGELSTTSLNAQDASSAPAPSSSPLSKAAKRLSTASRASVATGTDGSEHDPEVGDGTRRLQGEGGSEGEEDEGEESDPEDSETPWTCMLVLRKLASGTSSSEDHAAPPTREITSGSVSNGGTIKIKVATVSPTPHHPKVVSLLKIPFPLPDLVIDTMEVRKRGVSPQGIAKPNWNENAAAAMGGLVLTAEEIKDIVSATALWLVVRKGIGGVGKVSRKGDGWRIRG